MADKKITGAVGIAGRVFRAGQEAEMEAAAKEAEVDLSSARFAGALEGYDTDGGSDAGSGTFDPASKPALSGLKTAELEAVAKAEGVDLSAAKNNGERAAAIEAARAAG